MKNRMILLMSGCLVMLAGAACGGKTTVSPTLSPSAPTNTVQPTLSPSTPTNTVQPNQPPATEVPDNAQATTSGCEEYFGFCVTSSVSGTVTGAATAGAGSSFGNDCAAWAAAGDPRILELPTVLAAGENKITVALSRIGAYTGPGSYELAAVTSSGNPDSFPAIEVDGRTFSNGEGSTAVVTVAADGSGSLQATGLMELASIQVSNPDPDARIDLSMQWTCQEES